MQDQQPTALEYLSRRRRLGVTLVEAAIWTAVGTVAYKLAPSDIMGLIGIIILNVGYRTAMFHQYGATIGHMAMKAKLVNNTTGGDLTLQQAAIRSICQLLNHLMIPVIINMIMVMLRKDKRHLYDLIANTVTIRHHDLTWQAENETSMTPSPAD